ncbi:MAG: hypothetical protein CMG71_08050 [Candidatus Marinimicrobia bacterium]|nr:hypothetical protein [Candidatus Neomarinimicrobiota bacterium]|tara:strand:- start:5123 stop:5731 length:609 start_codon:yes stop_codon:yes gene_type:complete
MLKYGSRIIAGLALFVAALASEYDEEILYDISGTVLDKKGHTFEVRWFYRLDEESWKGEGTLKIFGKDYLSLDLPFMEVLIQKSIMSVKYPEENQVLIDYFNRRDSSNLFAVLLSEFDGFIVEDISASEEKVELTLLPETPVGFDRLEITVDDNSLMPKNIHAVSGEEMEVNVDVLSVGPLEDREMLKVARLEAGEIIDLRE